MHVTTETHFLLRKTLKISCMVVSNVCDALTFLLDNIFFFDLAPNCIAVVGIPLGTNCAPLVADLFLFCYERDLIIFFLSDDKQADFMMLSTPHTDIWSI